MRIDRAIARPTMASVIACMLAIAQAGPVFALSDCTRNDPDVETHATAPVSHECHDDPTETAAADAHHHAEDAPAPRNCRFQEGACCCLTSPMAPVTPGRSGNGESILPMPNVNGTPVAHTFGYLDTRSRPGEFGRARMRHAWLPVPLHVAHSSYLI